jgi:hypothetical protein
MLKRMKIFLCDQSKEYFFEGEDKRIPMCLKSKGKHTLFHGATRVRGVTAVPLLGVTNRLTKESPINKCKTMKTADQIFHPCL